MTKISVVMPSYQSALFIYNTLQSVIDQTVIPSQVLIIDDGSTDNTCSIIEEFSLKHPEFNIQLIKSLHNGPGAARNIGIQTATSEWIAFLDSDDIWFPNKIAVTLQAINEYPKANFFCHNETMISEDGSSSFLDYSRYYSSLTPLPKQLYKKNLFSTSAVVCKRSDLLDNNGFDEHLSSAQDYELWLRMSPNLSPIFIKQILGIYTVRKGNISTTRHFRRMINIWKVMKRHRSKAGNFLIFLYTIFRVTLSHLVGFLRTIGK